METEEEYEKVYFWTGTCPKCGCELISVWQEHVWACGSANCEPEKTVPSLYLKATTEPLHWRGCYGSCESVEEPDE